MYQDPCHVYSSYTVNNIGETIYNVIRELKPEKIIDFGLLYGYSTICLAQAVRDNGVGHIIGYDLFESYKYRNSIKPIVEHNLNYYGLSSYVTLIKKDFYKWLEEDEKFDLIHLDISNNGEIIDKIYDNYPNNKIIFEGGTKERDEVKWMKNYNFSSINGAKLNYNILNPNFPGLSGINF